MASRNLLYPTLPLFFPVLSTNLPSTASTSCSLILFCPDPHNSLFNSSYSTNPLSPSSNVLNASEISSRDESCALREVMYVIKEGKSMGRLSVEKYPRSEVGEASWCRD